MAQIFHFNIFFFLHRAVKEEIISYSERNEILRNLKRNNFFHKNLIIDVNSLITFLRENHDSEKAWEKIWEARNNAGKKFSRSWLQMQIYAEKQENFLAIILVHSLLLSCILPK